MKKGEINIYHGNGDLNYVVESKLTSYFGKSVSDSFSLKWVGSGVEHYTIENKMHDVVHDNFIVVNPGQEVKAEVNYEHPVDGLCFFLDPNLLSEIKNLRNFAMDHNLDNKSTLPFSSEYDNIPVNSYSTIFYDLLNNKVSFKELEKAEISDLLILLAEKYVFHQSQRQFRLKQLEASRTIAVKELYKRIQLARQYIHDNYQNTLSLEEIGDAVGLSQYYFHRNFRNYFALTPHQYHTKVRIGKARDLIQSGHCTKTEAAYLCGYDNPKYFYKVYKKWEGLI